jgi:ABC-type enterobactin transport system permease subunit
MVKNYTRQDCGDDESGGVRVESCDELVEEDVVTVVRAPRYFRFMFAGAFLGVSAAFILTFAFPRNPEFGIGQVFGFLLLGCLAGGVAVGATAAVILDRVARRRVSTGVADHKKLRKNPV